MENHHELLLNLLDKGNYKYSYQGDTLSFMDKRVNDITVYNFNQALYNAIRSDSSIRVLDLSHVQSIPESIENFFYIEEIIMPKLTTIIPRIKNCPNVYHIFFDPKTITFLCNNSFQGWPLMNRIKFGPSLKRIDSFGASSCKALIMDFSDCCNLSLNDHAFQYNTTLKKCILPINITQLPNYVFMGCVNLSSLTAMGVKNIYPSSFSGNFKLRKVEISQEMEERKIKWLIEGDDFHRDFDSRQSGIVLEVDSHFTYIFSFVNFKFYYTENSGNLKKYDFITFNHDVSFSYLIKNGLAIISGNYDNYHALNILDFNSSDFLPFANKYKGCCGIGVHSNPKDLQFSSYLSLKNEVRKKYTADLRCVVNDVIKTVESLNINEVIDSYHTEIEEEVITKIGGDDTFYSSIRRFSQYSDPYMETLLPSFHSYAKEMAYTSHWDYADKNKWEQEDEKYRIEAKIKYNKEHHISFLLNNYIQTLVKESIKSEKYLHISRALEELGTEIDVGVEKVRKLNSKFFI